MSPANYLKWEVHEGPFGRKIALLRESLNHDKQVASIHWTEGGVYKAYTFIPYAGMGDKDHTTVVKGGSVDMPGATGTDFDDVLKRASGWLVKELGNSVPGHWKILGSEEAKPVHTDTVRRIKPENSERMATVGDVADMVSGEIEGRPDSEDDNPPVDPNPGAKVG